MEKRCPVSALKSALSRFAGSCMKNKLSVSLIALAAIAITAAAIKVRQNPLTVLPLYVSLTVGMLSAGANRYANVIGAANCILYTVVNIYFHLYAQALSALLISCPFQIVIFLRWNKNAYKSSTRFRRLRLWQIFAILGASAAAFALISLALGASDSSYPILDNAMSVVGTLSMILSVLCFREYAWVQLAVGVLSLALDAVMIADNPARIAFLIYSIYSMICIIRQFFAVRRLWREQQAENIPTAEPICA